MTSNPINPASMKMNRALIRMELFIGPPGKQLALRHRGRHSKKLAYPGVCHLTVARQQRVAHDFVFHVELQLLVLDQVQQKRGYVPGAMPFTISSVSSTGDFFPGMTAAVMTTSLSLTTRPSSSRWRW